MDPLNALVLIVITVFAGLALWAAPTALQDELPGQERFVYPLMLLLVTGLLGMTVTGDAFNLYVMLEITSLSSYALVAIGKGRAAVSCFTYIVMGTIGASFYLLGVGYLYLKTGSLNMLDIKRVMLEGHLIQSQTSITGFILITVGLWIKMGLFPLHGWLPNAYAFAPHAVTNLIAPLMTKVSVYVAVRYMLMVFTPDFMLAHENWSDIGQIIACVAIGAGSLIAYSQTDLKKLLCYLLVAEVGYMVGGMWLVNPVAFKGVIYHIVSDAAMTSCLFLGAASVIQATGHRHVHALRHAAKTMPWTFAAFVLGFLSMIGVPPTCGFFSKWFLISGAVAEGAWWYVAALLFSSLMNALIFFRLVEMALFSDVAHPADEVMDMGKNGEAAIGLRLPLWVSSLFVLGIGLAAQPFGGWIERIVRQVGGWP